MKKELMRTHQARLFIIYIFVLTEEPKRTNPQHAYDYILYI